MSHCDNLTYSDSVVAIAAWLCHVQGMNTTTTRELGQLNALLRECDTWWRHIPLLGRHAQRRYELAQRHFRVVFDSHFGAER
jgi:hypothetical protein